MMGGRDSHRGEKRASLCLASVCFLGVFCTLEKVGLPPEKKMAGRLVLDPLLQANQHFERIKSLDHIKFPWTTGTHQERWSMHYEELVEFHATNGHCNVHRAYSLGQWVNHQRQTKKNGKLSAKRIELLDNLGFEWSRV